MLFISVVPIIYLKMNMGQSFSGEGSLRVLFFSFVWSRLEYACVAWCLHFRVCIDLIELLSGSVDDTLFLAKLPFRVPALNLRNGDTLYVPR